MDALTKINNAFLILTNTRKYATYINDTIYYNFSNNSILTDLENSGINNSVSTTEKNQNDINHFDFKKKEFLKVFDILLSDIYEKVCKQIGFNIERIFYNEFNCTSKDNTTTLEKNKRKLTKTLEKLKATNDKSPIIKCCIYILKICLSNINSQRLDEHYNQFNGIYHENFNSYPDIKNLKIKTCIKWFLAEYYIYNNSLIQYFLKKYTEKSISGDNWIDIEAELSNIIEKVESSFGIEQATLDRLEDELDVFTLLLRNYLIHEENIFKDKTKNNQVKKIPDINKIASQITHLLSFNYTNTFRLLYYPLEKANVDFIHGSLPENNLVLGVNETLNNIDENSELICIYFKKYFQRIFKKTGAKYADWLNDKNGINFDTVYIYGHSLDITDKEILSRVINDIHIDKIVIYYHNKAHYRQEISNLVKILDKNIFLKYVAEHRIEFKEQSS